MIKTQPPKAHIWSHPSEFQRTKAFRKINFEDCEASATGEILVQHAEDALLSAQDLTAKRRRIERLSNNFLDGKPLFISSVRPNSQSLSATVHLNVQDYGAHLRRSRTEIRSVPSTLWTERRHSGEEEEDAILERLAQRRLRDSPNKRPKIQVDRFVARQANVVEARARCRPLRRARSVHVTADPSMDAYEQAAALHARKSLRAASELPLAYRPSPTAMTSATSSAEPRSDPVTTLRRSSVPGTTDLWLSRRQSRFSFSKYVPDDDSQDELRLSNTEAPACYPGGGLNQVLKPEAYSIPSGDFSHQHSNAKSDAGSIECRVPVDRRNCKSSHGHSSRSNASYHASLEPIVSQSENRLPELRSPNEQNSSRARKKTSPASLTMVSDGSAQSPPSRRTRSTTANIKARVGTQGASGYTTASASQSNSTPFIFRKRRSALARESDSRSDIPKDISARSTRRRSPPLRDSVQSADDLESPKGTEAVNDKATASDARHDDIIISSARLNERSPSTEKRTSIVPLTSPKQVDPDNSRLDVFSKTTDTRLSPLTISALPSSDSSSREPKSRPSLTWAGTQFLLETAQRDLFASPDKTSVPSQESVHQTPRHKSETPKARPPSSKGNLLSQHSQEPLPSTQQLLGEFQGWSTVKKPRPGIRHSLLPTSTIKQKEMLAQADTPTVVRISSSAPQTSLKAKSIMKANMDLCDSITSTAPPPVVDSLPNGSEGALTEAHGDAPSLVDSTNEPMTTLSGTGPVTVDPAKSTILQDSTTVIRIASAPVSSFHAARRSPTFIHEPADISLTSNDLHEPPVAQKSPVSTSESLDLSQTVDDLSALLDVSEMHGILSQVS